MGLLLSIVTPQRAVLETEVDSVVAPGAEGEFGVLPEHEAFLAPLRPGVVRYRGGDGSGRVAVASGFAETISEVSGEHGGHATVIPIHGGSPDHRSHLLHLLRVRLPELLWEPAVGRDFSDPFDSV